MLVSVQNKSDFSALNLPNLLPISELSSSGDSYQLW